MGVITREREIVSSIQPERLFKAMVVESHALMPKILPHAIKSIHVHGDGGPGTILTTIFAQDASIPFTDYKRRVEVLDVENLKYKYSVVEGDVLKDKYEKITMELKFVAGGTDSGGSVVKIKTELHSISSDVNEEEMEVAREKALQGFKAIEAYLVANPDVCN